MHGFYLYNLPVLPLSEGRSIRLLYCLKSYFPAGESALSKKMPGLEKIREIREKENQL